MSTKAYLGPWVAGPYPRSFVAPAGSRPLLNLSPNHSPGSLGLFLAPSLSLDYQVIGDPATYAWNALLNAAPDGSGVLPLVPTFELSLELHLGPLGRVRAEQFEWGRHPHTNRLRDLLREHFRSHWAVSPTLARKALDWTRRKYGLLGVDEWHELVPTDLLPHVEGPLPHATSYSDNFNRADAATLGSNWTSDFSSGATWAFQIVSNRASVPSSGGFWFAMYNSNLSGSDNQTNLDFSVGSGVDEGGPTCRVDSTTPTQRTGYAGFNRLDNATSLLWQVINGTMTLIANGAGVSSPPFTGTVKASGSTISYTDGTNNLSVTDTGITTGLRGGMGVLYAGTQPSFDNWLTQDVSAGSGGAGAASFAFNVASAPPSGAGAASFAFTVAGGGAARMAGAGAASFMFSVNSAIALILGFIGDSIWALTNGYGTRDIPTIVGHLLAKMGAIRTVTIDNQAVSGTSTSNWVPGGSGEPIYTNALNSFIAAGMANNANAYVVIMLGANDAASGNSDVTYAGNLAAIVSVGANALLNRGLKVILCYPIWRGDSPAYAPLLLSYEPKIDGMINGTTILRGDVLGYNWFLQNPGELADLIHCNAQGSESDAEMVAWAIWNMLYNGSAVGPILSSSIVQGAAA